MPAARWLDFLMSGTTVTSMRRGNLIEVLFGFANVLADYMLVSTRAATWQFVADDFGRQGFLVSGGRAKWRYFLHATIMATADYAISECDDTADGYTTFR